jgi:hypothetical protein
MELGGTIRQQLVFLNTHWGSKCSFAEPESRDAQWTVTAKFGQRGQLHEWSATELLELVRGHYQANKPRDNAR